MRLMSFALTENAFLGGTKDVTRRLGWTFLKPGDKVMAVRKAMGLKRGEHPVQLGVVEIVSVRREALSEITPDEVVREGFDGWTTTRFVRFFCDHMKCGPGTLLTRIEFRRFVQRYPEHEKLKVVAEKTQFVHDFLTWCEGLGIFLEKDGVYQRHDNLLYKYVEVDRWKLEDEKREMLGGLQKEMTK